MPDRIFYSITSGFLGGVFLASHVSVPKEALFLFLIVGSVSLILAIIFKRHLIFIPIIFICLSAVFGVWRFEKKDTQSDLAQHLGKNASFDAVISDDPDVRDNNQKLLLAVGRENVLATVPKYPDFRYGDMVRVEGTLALPQNFTTEYDREFDYQNYLRKDDIFTVIPRGTVSLISEHNASAIKERLFDLKHYLLGLLSKNMPSPESTFAGGLLLGDRRTLGDDIRKSLVATGTIHMIALSGYNVSIVANWIREGLLMIPLVGERLALFFGALGIVAFVLMTGAQSSAVRAGVMALLALLARATGRTYDIARALAFAGVVMVFFAPKILAFDISFQLSFVATLGMIFLSPIFEKKFARIRNKYIREALITTLAAQIAVLPLIMNVMGIFSIVSLPVNVLIMPFIPPVMIFIAVALLAMMIGFPFALIFSIPLSAVLASMLFIIQKAGAIPFAAISVGAFPTVLMLALYAALIFWTVRTRKRLALS